MGMGGDGEGQITNKGHAKACKKMPMGAEGQNHLQHDEQLVEVETVLLHGPTRRISVILGGRLKPSDGCSLRSPSVVASCGTAKTECSLRSPWWPAVGTIAKTECHSPMTMPVFLGEQLRA